MKTFTVKTPFDTRTRRLPADAEITESDLADDALGVAARVARGDIVAGEAAGQAEPAEPAEPPAEPAQQDEPAAPSKPSPRKKA